MFKKLKNLFFSFLIISASSVLACSKADKEYWPAMLDAAQIEQIQNCGHYLHFALLNYENDLITLQNLINEKKEYKRALVRTFFAKKNIYLSSLYLAHSLLKAGINFSQFLVQAADITKQDIGVLEKSDEMDFFKICGLFNQAFIIRADHDNVLAFVAHLYDTLESATSDINIQFNKQLYQACCTPESETLLAHVLEQVEHFKKVIGRPFQYSDCLFLISPASIAAYHNNMPAINFLEKELGINCSLFDLEGCYPAFVTDNESLYKELVHKTNFNFLIEWRMALQPALDSLYQYEIESHDVATTIIELLKLHGSLAKIQILLPKIVSLLIRPKDLGILELLLTADYNATEKCYTKKGNMAPAKCTGERISILDYVNQELKTKKHPHFYTIKRLIQAKKDEQNDIVSSSEHKEKTEHKESKKKKSIDTLPIVTPLHIDEPKMNRKQREKAEKLAAQRIELETAQALEADRLKNEARAHKHIKPIEITPSILPAIGSAEEKISFEKASITAPAPIVMPHTPKTEVSVAASSKKKKKKKLSRAEKFKAAQAKKITITPISPKSPKSPKTVTFSPRSSQMTFDDEGLGQITDTATKTVSSHNIIHKIKPKTLASRETADHIMDTDPSTINTDFNEARTALPPIEYEVSDTKEKAETISDSRSRTVAPLVLPIINGPKVSDRTELAPSIIDTAKTTEIANPTADFALAQEIYARHKKIFDQGTHIPRCIPGELYDAFNDGTIDPAAFCTAHARDVRALIKEKFQKFAFKRTHKKAFTNDEKISLILFLLAEEVCRGCSRCFNIDKASKGIKKLTLPPYLKDLEKEV